MPMDEEDFDRASFCAPAQPVRQGSLGGTQHDSPVGLSVPLLERHGPVGPLNWQRRDRGPNDSEDTAVEAQSEYAYPYSPRHTVPEAVLEDQRGSTSNSNSHSAHEIGTSDGGQKEFETASLGERTRLRDEWLWEFRSWILATLALVGLVVMLVVLKDKPRTAWKIPLSINTVVQALCEIARAGLVVPLASCIGQRKWNVLKKKPVSMIDLEQYDRASRGASGSRRLIQSQLRHGTLGLVSFGALTLLLLPAYSIFAQQAVSMDAIRPRNLTINATIPRAVSYNAPSLDQDSAGTLPSTLDGAMRTAQFQGVVGPPANYSTVPGSCITGNCTWPAYETLGFCSRVDRDTHSMTIDCTPKNAADVLGNYCGMQFQPSFSELEDALDGNLYINQSTTFQLFGSVQENGSVDVYVMYAQDPRTSGGGLFTVMQGHLDLCIHSLQTNIINGEVKTELLNSSSLLGSGLNIGSSQMGGLMRPIAGNVFTGTVASFVSSDGTWEQSFNGERDVLWRWMADVYGEQAVAGADYSSQRLDFSGFSARLENIAISLSNALRLNTDQEAVETVIGITHGTEQYIHVSIPWLIMPIALWALVTLFFAATVVSTRDAKVPIWKNSMLATMQPGDKPGGASEIEARTRAYDVRLKLMPEATGWRVHKVN